MQYRALGRTGIQVSALGFGCMRLPTLGSADRIDEAASTKLLHDAIDGGVNYVDTAWFYHARVFGQRGFSEPFVGRALSGGWRQKVQLATKLPAMLVKTRADMDRYLTEQLEALQTDHVDFYLVHGVDGAAWNVNGGAKVRRVAGRSKSAAPHRELRENGDGRSAMEAGGAVVVLTEAQECIRTWTSG